MGGKTTDPASTSDVQRGSVSSEEGGGEREEGRGLGGGGVGGGEGGEGGEIVKYA